MIETVTATEPCGTRTTAHPTCRFGRVLRRLAGAQPEHAPEATRSDNGAAESLTHPELLVRQRGPVVLVRSPQCEELARVLTGAGFAVRRELGNEWVGSLTVSGASAEQVGELAASHGLVLHELRTDSPG
ncbi:MULTISPECIES: hypothetical protein [unclassified Crossiella]|uniref:hypothetical protein n=1 Tax=unclassified Crossiella TaxID=2620835 RepID=UPI001FFE4207|nr:MULTISPECIES: hypothetical protein [unclassified Crossiella]MCK2236315.1 hypothetical protein [Crossiella sp. S99.2]MCK2249982.1 hypothetical protein [Crossiella sp. S99.1]